MATQYVDYPSVVMNRKFVWSGIFSGTFLFLAIEATFGVLGAAIFASAVNAAPTNATSPNIGVGAGIWMVVLSIIALYFAGRLASTYSATATRNAGMYAGLVTYGLCILTAFVIAALASLASGTVAHTGAVAGSTAFDSIVPGGYWLFAAMVLGMIAAGFGGIQGAVTSGLRTMERANETKRVA